MKTNQYPALYVAADKASGSSQRVFLHSIRCEYALLIAAAAFGLDLSISPYYHAAYVAVIALALAAMTMRALGKPEQKWYKARAISESVKTLTWRYMMKADPFDDPNDHVSAGIFRNRLKATLDDSRFIGGDLAVQLSGTDQITAEMRRVRSMDLLDRIAYYKAERVDNQRSWYAKKAADNRTAGRRWFAFAAVIYVLGIGAAVLRIAEPEWEYLKADPIIVVASAVIGWMQIKRHNELSTSYALTAHEIGLIKLGYEDIKDEADLSEFINEAELAFSREHTQWAARRQ